MFVYVGILWATKYHSLGQSAGILAAVEVQQSSQKQINCEEREKKISFMSLTLEKGDIGKEGRAKACQNSLCGFGWV